MKKNPIKPLSFYLDGKIKNYKLYSNLSDEEKLTIANSQIKFQKILFEMKKENNDFPYYVGFLENQYDKKYVYLIGIVEIHRLEGYIEYHDFFNVIETIPLTSKSTKDIQPIVDRIFAGLVEFFIDLLQADVSRIKKGESRQYIISSKEDQEQQKRFELAYKQKEQESKPIVILQGRPISSGPSLGVGPIIRRKKNPKKLKKKSSKKKISKKIKRR